MLRINVCVAMWKSQVSDHAMKSNIPSGVSSVVLRAYLQGCKLYLAARLPRSAGLLDAGPHPLP